MAHAFDGMLQKKEAIDEEIPESGYQPDDPRVLKRFFGIKEDPRWV